MNPSERLARAKAAAHRRYREALELLSRQSPQAARHITEYVELLQTETVTVWAEVHHLTDVLARLDVDPRLIDDHQEGAPSGQEANDETADGTAREREPDGLERQGAGTRAGGPLLGVDPRPAGDPDGRAGGAAMVTGQHPELAGALVLAFDAGDDRAALTIMRQWMELPGGLVGMTKELATSVADLMAASAGDQWRDVLGYALLDVSTRDGAPDAS